LPSFGAVLGALALKLAVLPDDQALARIRHRLPRRGTGGERLEAVPRRRCRAKQARELAAALMRLRKGRRRKDLRPPPRCEPFGLS
jgi:hypothetical protein